MNDQDKQQYLTMFGRYVQQLRKQRGWTQEELATKCGYTSASRKTTIQKIEAGKSDLPASKIQTLASVFGIKPSQLFDLPQEVQDEVMICDLFERCYGKESYQAVQMFLKLDHDDRQDIVDLMESKLKRDKYNPPVKEKKKAITA